jgi:hypothetical protein
MKLVRERYEGFVPTLAQEKLTECHSVRDGELTLNGHESQRLSGSTLLLASCE